MEVIKKVNSDQRQNVNTNMKLLYMTFIHRTTLSLYNAKRVYYHALQRREIYVIISMHVSSHFVSLNPLTKFLYFFSNNLHLKHDSGEVVEKQK